MFFMHSVLMLHGIIVSIFNIDQAILFYPRPDVFCLFEKCDLKEILIKLDFAFTNVNKNMYNAGHTLAHNFRNMFLVIFSL